jgi:hypothetical protein
MIDVTNILGMLRPNGGFVVVGNSFDGAQFFECEPVTKKEFDDAAKKYDAWKSKKAADELAKRQAILDRIGLTADELQTILG